MASEAWLIAFRNTEAEGQKTMGSFTDCSKKRFHKRHVRMSITWPTLQPESVASLGFIIGRQRLGPGSWIILSATQEFRCGLSDTSECEALSLLEYRTSDSCWDQCLEKGFAIHADISSRLNYWTFPIKGGAAAEFKMFVTTSDLALQFALEKLEPC